MKCDNCGEGFVYNKNWVVSRATDPEIDFTFHKPKIDSEIISNKNPTMTNLPNEITIEGETYVKKKTGKEQITPSCSCPCNGKKGNAGCRCDCISTHWPQEGDKIWYILSDGFLGELNYHFNSKVCKNLIKFGNFFQTKEEAEMYALRIESLSKGFMPKEDGDGFFEDFWIWDFMEGKPYLIVKSSQLTMKQFLKDAKFRTKEECQEWYNQYGKGWEYKI